MRFFANAQNDFDLHGFDGEGGLGGGVSPPTPGGDFFLFFFF